MMKIADSIKIVRVIIKINVLMIWSFQILSACSTDNSTIERAVNYLNPKIESCKLDSLNSYHILVPGAVEASQKIPLIVVLDAHGSGMLAVRNFQDAVRDFPCLVVGSDLIKNNFSGYENAIIQLINDVKFKYPVDEQQIIIAGFSGGARMAYYFAVKYKVKGLLMCGAGPGQQMPKCPVYMISGMGDFNFSEQYHRPTIASFTDEQKTTAYFHGVHEWPEPSQLKDALLILLRDIERLKALRQNRSIECLQVADSLANSENQLKSWQALKKSAKMAEKNSIRKRAIKHGNELLNNEEFQEVIRTLENDLRTEQKMQQAYVQAMSTKDFGWWKNELTLLDKKLKTDNSGIKADHYLRIKGFIGILFYSRINSLINSDPDNPQLKNMLRSYAFAEPENADPYYFMALYARLNGDNEACIKNRSKAIELGFTDRGKLKNITF